MISFEVIRPGDERRSLVRTLFLEYQEELGLDLGFQGFPAEIASLPGKYGPPRGVLLLVCEEGVALACGALRDLGGGICELKRIYVRPAARRRGLAREISERLLDFAVGAGYTHARLDTLRRLTGALELYGSFGFLEIPPYNYNPEADIVYLELSLRTLLARPS